MPSRLKCQSSAHISVGTYAHNTNVTQWQVHLARMHLRRARPIRHAVHCCRFAMSMSSVHACTINCVARSCDVLRDALTGRLCAPTSFGAHAHVRRIVLLGAVGKMSTTSTLRLMADSWMAWHASRSPLTQAYCVKTAQMVCAHHA
jgi:hypothetical protein